MCTFCAQRSAKRTFWVDEAYCKRFYLFSLLDGFPFFMVLLSISVWAAHGPNIGCCCCCCWKPLEAAYELPTCSIGLKSKNKSKHTVESKRNRNFDHVCPRCQPGERLGNGPNPGTVRYAKRVILCGYENRSVGSLFARR